MSYSPYPVSGFTQRAGLLAVVWWIISDGVAGSWLIGVPAVLIAAHLSMALNPTPTQRVHLISLVKFIPFFLYESIRGGIDVAHRACSSRLPMAPAFLIYPLRLPEGAAQTFFAGIVSLLPGTLSTRIKGRALQLHVLDDTAQIVKELEILELKVAGIFRIDVTRTGYHERGARR